MKTCNHIITPAAFEALGEKEDTYNQHHYYEINLNTKKKLGKKNNCIKNGWAQNMKSTLYKQQEKSVKKQNQNKSRKNGSELPQIKKHIWKETGIVECFDRT